MAFPTPSGSSSGVSWRAAADAWLAVDAPYEAALAALPGTDAAARRAIEALHRIGARAAAKRVRA